MPGTWDSSTGRRETLDDWLEEWRINEGWQASKAEVQRLVDHFLGLRETMGARDVEIERLVRVNGALRTNVRLLETAVADWERSYPDLTSPETPEDSPQSASEPPEAQPVPETGEGHTDSVWVRSQCGHEVQVWLHENLSPPAIGQYGWCSCEHRICRAVSIELVET
jgi:hypothetical protein